MALSGMTFVITGKSNLARKDLEKKIKDASGVVSARLSKKATHCLCGEGFEETEKYVQSKEQGIHVVSEEFIDACIRNHSAGADLPEEKAYLPHATEGKEKNSTENADNADEEEEKGEKIQKNDEENDENGDKTSQQEQATTEGTHENSSPSKKSRSPRKKKVRAEQVSSVLSGWIIVLDGRLSKPHSEITQFVESNGGKVASNLAGKTAVTHLLVNDLDEESQKREQAKDSGVTIIDEDYLEWFVEDAVTKQKGSPQKTKKNRRVDKIISRRIFRAEYQYLVSFVGLGADANEYLSRDEVEKKLGAKQLKHFEKDWEKSMNDVFDADKFFTDEIPKKKNKTSEKGESGKSKLSKTFETKQPKPAKVKAKRGKENVADKPKEKTPKKKATGGKRRRSSGGQKESPAKKRKTRH